MRSTILVGCTPQPCGLVTILTPKIHRNATNSKFSSRITPQVHSRGGVALRTRTHIFKFGRLLTSFIYSLKVISGGRFSVCSLSPPISREGGRSAKNFYDSWWPVAYSALCANRLLPGAPTPVFTSTST